MECVDEVDVMLRQCCRCNRRVAKYVEYFKVRRGQRSD